MALPIPEQPHPLGQPGGYAYSGFAHHGELRLKALVTELVYVHSRPVSRTAKKLGGLIKASAWGWKKGSQFQYLLVEDSSLYLIVDLIPGDVRSPSGFI